MKFVDFYKQYGGRITTVKTSAGLAARTADYLTECRSGGYMGIVCDDNCLKIGDDVEKSLVERGFQIKRLNLAVVSDKNAAQAIIELPEYVGFLIAVGGGTTADLVKYAGDIRKNPVAVVATTLSTEGYLAPYAEFIMGNEYIDCAPPVVALFDTEILKDNGPEFLAAGYGRALLWAQKLVDNEAERLISGRSKQPYAEALSAEIKDYLISAHTDFACETLDILLKIGSLSGKFAKNVDGFCNILTQSGNRLHGENAFLAAYLTLNIYKIFLKGNVIDTLVPPDLTKTLKLLDKNYGWDYNKNLADTPSFTEDGYFRNCYILGEYREDMAQTTSNALPDGTARRWRRIYADAGYWVESYINFVKLMRLRSLSAERDTGLIRHIKRIGFLENYI